MAVSAEGGDRKLADFLQKLVKEEGEKIKVIMVHH